MIASGKTIVESAKLLHEHGASEVYVFATHPVFSKEAPELLENSLIKKVFVANTVDVPHEKQFPKLEVLSVADMVAAELRNER
jgi:ribose-phosphate pyrophosphokinase